MSRDMVLAIKVIEMSTLSDLAFETISHEEEWELSFYHSLVPHRATTARFLDELSIEIPRRLNWYQKIVFSRDI